MIAIFFIGDRYLKALAIATQNSARLLGDILTFSFTPNYFIAFSLPISGTILEILISLLILIMLGLFFYLLIKKKKTWLFFGLTAVLLGAISNFIDRLNFGYVIDYLYLKHFTVFNLADALIVFGSIAIFFGLNKKTNR
ncbi:MAG: signal peptidase II [Patescibacteria group bacterium]